MNFLLYSSARPSTRCSSLVVPSVVVTIACVSPRWKTAEPWVRGSTPTSQVIDHVNHFDNLLVGEHDRLDHILLGHLAGKALDHGDGRSGAGHHQVQVA